MQRRIVLSAVGLLKRPDWKGKCASTVLCRYRQYVAACKGTLASAPPSPGPAGGHAILKRSVSLRSSGWQINGKSRIDGLDASQDQSKLTVYERLKSAFKKYWYVLVPVHLLTSAFWYGSLYYLIASGVDVVGVLESLGVSERLIKAMRSRPEAGNIALTIAICKVIAPIRYALTLGVSALSVRYLVRFGLIKPAPSREQMRRYVERQRNRIRERYQRLRKDATGLRGKLATKWRAKKGNGRAKKV